LNAFHALVNFLKELDERKIHYNLRKIRDSILIEVAVPGQRWEIEFMMDGSIEIEKFISSGDIFGSEEIEVLFREFSD